MKHLVGFVCAAALVVGCGPDIDLAERPLFSNGVNTLTFMVYDGFTGAGVENAQLSVLVGGYTIEARAEGNVYVASQLPQGTFPTFVDAPGYLSFVGSASPNGTGSLLPSANTAGPATQSYRLYQVVLYPESRVANDIVVKAFESDGGAAVASGQVVATLTSANAFLGVTLDSLLAGTFTTRPTTLIASIGADGTAVLPKEKLVLGGSYSIDVFGATNAGGTYLTPAQNATIVAGQSFPQINLFMGPPAVTPVAITTNNEEPGIYQTWVVTFPYPVEVCNNPDVHAWTVASSQGDLNTNGIVASPAAENPVGVAINGGAVTFSPNFGTGNNAFDPGDGLLDVTFTNVGFRVVGGSTCTQINAIPLRDGGLINRTIRYNDTIVL